MPVVLPTYIVGKGTGDTEFAVIGTGTSVPAGVEGYFIYSDLVLNHRDAIDTYLISSIDWSEPDVRDSRENLPRQHGERAFQSFYSGRTIILNGRIRAHEIKKLRDMQEALKLAFVSLEEKPLKIQSNFQQEQVFINCRKNVPIAMREEQQGNKFWRDFMITLRASDPTFKSMARPTYTIVAASGVIGNFTATNIGNYEAKARLILFGPMINPQITNTRNGKIVKINATIANSDSYTFDVDAGTLMDEAGVSKFSKLDTISDFLTIEPGENIFTVSATGLTNGTSAVSLSFHNTWI